MARVVIEGSSTAWGYGSGAGGGWAERLKATYKASGERTRSKYIEVINVAAPSKSLDDITASLPANLSWNAKYSRVRAAIMQVGAIESRFTYDTHGNATAGMSLERFAEAISTIGAICADHSFHPIFIGTTPVDETRTKHMIAKGKRYSMLNSVRQEYSDITSAYAAEHAATFVDVQTPLIERLDMHHTIHHSDGFHLNSLGHRVLLETIKPVVDAELLRQTQALETISDDIAM